MSEKTTEYAPTSEPAMSEERLGQEMAMRLMPIFMEKRTRTSGAKDVEMAIGSGRAFAAAWVASAKDE